MDSEKPLSLARAVTTVDTAPLAQTSTQVRLRINLLERSQIRQRLQSDIQRSRYRPTKALHHWAKIRQAYCETTG